MTSSVNILIAGDEFAGKTSLINTFISSTFSDEVTAGNLEVKIPRENVVYGKNVNILDCHDNPIQLDLQLRKTDCVVILADCSRPSSVAAVNSYWLPLVRDVFAATAAVPSPTADGAQRGAVNNKTAIIALSKADLLSTEDLDAVLDNEKWNTTFSEFPFVACITSFSAKNLNVKGVIDMAARLASYPLWPLYDISKQQCTPAMWRAFKRIFRIHDRDLDGLLSDSELNSFQRNCDWDIIKREELVAIKRKIMQTFSSRPSGGGVSTGASEGHLGAFSTTIPIDSMIQSGQGGGTPAASETASTDAPVSPVSCSTPQRPKQVGVVKDRITFDGFFSLIVEVTCRDLNLAIPWTALQVFNYNESLELEIPKDIRKIPQVPVNCCLALSAGAVDFLFALQMNANGQTMSQGADGETETSTPGVSSESDSEYVKKVPRMTEPSAARSAVLVPPFLNEALSVLSEDVEHPWKHYDAPKQPLPTPSSPPAQSPRLSKANLQRAVSGSSVGGRSASGVAAGPSTKSEVRRADTVASKQNHTGTNTDQPSRKLQALPPYLFENCTGDVAFYISCMKALTSPWNQTDSERVGSMTTDVYDLTAQWLTHWHMLAMKDPVLVKTLLYRLGYGNVDMGLSLVPCHVRNRYMAASEVKSSGMSRISHSHATNFSTHLSISILGCSEVDIYKYGLLTAISDINMWSEGPIGQRKCHEKSTSISSSEGPVFETESSHCIDEANCGNQLKKNEGPGARKSFSELKYGSERIVSGGCHLYASDVTGSCQTFWKKPAHSASPFASLSSVFIIASTVPSTRFDKWAKNCKPGNVDVAVLLYARGSESSLNTAVEIEKQLPDTLPRLFIQVEADSCGVRDADEFVYNKATDHMAAEGIYQPLKLPCSGPMSFSVTDAKVLVEQCLRVTADAEERGIPLPHRGRMSSPVWRYLGTGFGTLGVLSLCALFYARPQAVASGLNSMKEYATPLLMQLNSLVATGGAYFQRTIRTISDLYGSGRNHRLLK